MFRNYDYIIIMDILKIQPAQTLRIESIDANGHLEALQVKFSKYLVLTWRQPHNTVTVHPHEKQNKN